MALCKQNGCLCHVSLNRYPTGVFITPLWTPRKSLKVTLEPTKRGHKHTTNTPSRTSSATAPSSGQFYDRTARRRLASPTTVHEHTHRQCYTTGPCTGRAGPGQDRQNGPHISRYGSAWRGVQQQQQCHTISWAIYIYVQRLNELPAWSVDPA